MLIVALVTSFIVPLQFAFWNHMRSSVFRMCIGWFVNVMWILNVAVRLPAHGSSQTASNDDSFACAGSR